jgi:hypothetical protein
LLVPSLLGISNVFLWLGIALAVLLFVFGLLITSAQFLLPIKLRRALAHERNREGSQN